MRTSFERECACCQLYFKMDYESYSRHILNYVTVVMTQKSDESILPSYFRIQYLISLILERNYDLWNDLRICIREVWQKSANLIVQPSQKDITPEDLPKMIKSICQNYNMINTITVLCRRIVKSVRKQGINMEDELTKDFYEIVIDPRLDYIMDLICSSVNASWIRIIRLEGFLQILNRISNGQVFLTYPLLFHLNQAESSDYLIVSCPSTSNHVSSGTRIPSYPSTSNPVSSDTRIPSYPSTSNPVSSDTRIPSYPSTSNHVSSDTRIPSYPSTSNHVSSGTRIPSYPSTSKEVSYDTQLVSHPSTEVSTEKEQAESNRFQFFSHLGLMHKDDTKAKRTNSFGISAAEMVKLKSKNARSAKNKMKPVKRSGHPTFRLRSSMKKPLERG